MRTLLLTVTAAWLVASRGAQAVDAEASRLFREFHGWRLKDDPEYATRQGSHEYDHQLTARSAAAEASRSDQMTILIIF